ncbi:AAA family ATPase [bacterium]|nr:AAA family ATPase [bacterium]
MEGEDSGKEEEYIIFTGKNMIKLERIQVEGFKSIKNLDLKFSEINVLIGANGAGKSNFVSLYKMINNIIEENLQLYISKSGGSNSILHYGSKNTSYIVVIQYFEDDSKNEFKYYYSLTNAAPDTLVFTNEEVTFFDKSTRKTYASQLWSGRKECNLNEAAKSDKPYISLVQNFLSRYRIFQFHDTAENSYARKKCYIKDNENLRGDAGNLAAYLYFLKLKKLDYYKRIVSTIRLAAPHFGDFELEPDRFNSNEILLNWREKDSDYLFGPHQISDGLLRFMALCTLLLQPEDFLPSVIIIDEPELGLHPYALKLLCSMIEKVSKRCQVILATQSKDLVDQFEPEDIIVVERHDGESIFKRLNSEDLKDWLEDYTLGELWEKNVIGGRPSR